MASSVWTATVWGNGKAAIIASNNRKIRPGEEECFICKDDVPASVALRPCGHKVCFGCVENLRAKNIFRADKGVKCPFCRQYVEQYDPCNSADPEQVRLLNEANRAAAIAQASRAPGGAAAGPGGGGTGGGGGWGGAATAAADDNWMCGTCRCLNLAHRDECGSCGRANPRGPRPTAITASTRGKDVLKCSDDEVIGFMQEKQQPNLQRCYQEIGIRVGAGRVVSDEDTPRRILNAFKQRGEERMLRLINVVSDPGVFYECSTHFLGNYGMQSLVEATLLIRKALAEAEAEGQHPLQSFRESHDGRDPHGVLLYAALPHAMELSTDERANYIVQKLADYATPLELVDMCGTLFPQGPSLAQNHKGVYVMNKLIMPKKLIRANGHHGAGLGGRGGGRFSSQGQHQQQAHVTPAPPATFDASYSAEGLFDPAAPVQASSGADGWAAAVDGTDPWAASTGADGWAAAPEPANAQPRQQAQPPAAGATHVGHAAGLAILQSLQTQQQPQQQQHSNAPAGVAAAAPAPAHPQPQPQPVMVTPVVVSAASAASHSAPAAAPRPHPLLAVNPALAAARALHQQNHAPANGPASPGQPHIITPQIVTPTVVHVTPQVHHQQPQQYQQQPQQYPLQPQYTSAGVAPPAAALPRPNLGFPMALSNPAMAVLNNTAGIAAFAPRPVPAVPVAVPLNSMPPPQPSATLMAFARSAPVNGPVATTSSAAAAAAAPRPAAQPQAPSPPPPPAGAPVPGGWWQGVGGFVDSASGRARIGCRCRQCAMTGARSQKNPSVA